MIAFALLLARIVPQGQPTPDDFRLIALARGAVSAEVSHRMQRMPGISTDPKPVFVTIEIRGQVRGCRGDLVARTKSLEAEVIREARAASGHDPRYAPLQTSDLRAFKVTVTIIDRKEPITDASTLQPEDGLVLQSGGRVGVVLPFEGRDATTRLRWAFRKSGAPNGAHVQLFRLIARRFRG
jgi:AMMECR1 domain-containing protein